MSRTLKHQAISLGIAMVIAACWVAAGVGAASAGTLLASGRLWAHSASGGPSPITVFDLTTDTQITQFSVPGNGRGVAFDPRDGNIWDTSVFGSFNGDGLIHKHPALGGAEILTIPDPGGVGGPGIGALDFDAQENVLWASSYQPVNGNIVYYKLNPSNGAVLHSCTYPMQGSGTGNDTMAITRPSDLGGKKVILTDAGEFGLLPLVAIDVNTCEPLKTYTLPVGVTGIAVDSATGDLIGTNPTSQTFFNFGTAPYASIISQLVTNVPNVEDITLGETKASPTITTSASPTAGQVVGTAIPVSDTATFQGTTSTAPTGSVSFTLFNSDCSVSTGVSGTGSISTSGGVSTASFSGTFTPTAPGTYQWIASYAGDPNNNGFTTVCGASGEQLTVIQASPTITTSASPTASQVVGTAIAVSDIATFQGTTSTAPTGSVSFTLFNSDCSVSTGVSGTGSISTSGGVSTASFSGSFTPTAPGTYQWIASYAGDANNNGFKTVCGASGEQLTVIQATPTITTSATVNATVGGTMLDTATLLGGAAPTGTITFTLFGPGNGCTVLAFTSTTPVSGNGTYSSAAFTPQLPGTYSWVASYSGDPNNNFATTTCGDTGETSAVFSFAPGGGSFVIGDKNAVVCSQKGGCTVTFWGAQWWKLNSLTGGPAPASFKGFAENPTTPTCGAAWSADTGNSTPPPDGPLPAFMAVIVTSNASQSGSTDSGNIVHIVIVHTNPGYAPDPGHAGTGTVVAVVC
jgi:hypothetical protein